MTTHNTANQEKTKILVIDDERLIRLTLSAKLKLIGYTAVCVASTQEAVTLLNGGGVKQFTAVITDIMMGEMDGFMFRDILRGMDSTMPVFFITALDPEEGSGFLKRIMEDSYSYYLPKSVKTDKLLQRVESIVSARRVDEFIKEKTKEGMDALNLAAHVQRNMLPPRINITDQGFYTTFWHPKDVVSGDLFEVMPLKDGGNLYVLGDIQGHGTSAALSMMAVQSFLKQLSLREDISNATPASIANFIQSFFSSNLGVFSYMTALICMHHPKEQIVDWITCGAPDLYVIDPSSSERKNINPEKRGGVPIGLIYDTVYTDENVIRTELSDSALCVMFSDGIFDIYKDQEGYEPLPNSLIEQLAHELLVEARVKGSVISAPYKLLQACEAYGYSILEDDVTGLIFGANISNPDILEMSIPINAEAIDSIAQKIEIWGADKGWGPEAVTKLQLVFEEKLMNLHDHGYDIRDRSREQACIRLKRVNDNIELTIWDCGSPEPSIAVAAGNADLEFELKNREFSGRGRGRLMVREICNAIQRNRFGILNETIYSIPMEEKQEN